MEIEVGEYVRTKRGYIGKVIKIRERIETYKNDREGYLVDWHDKRATYISQIKNIKHSKNITDLIEVGDYVNGYKVINLDTGYVYVDNTKLGTNLLKTFTDYQIEKIVTKERLKGIEYIIEEKLND